MRLAILMFALAACHKPPKTAFEVRANARESLLAAVGKPDGFLALMKGPVTNGGLWFADPACAKQFPPGEVAPAQLTAFAGCLAKLPFQASTREDALGDVIVLTYEPGFEVEARMVPSGSGTQLASIGFASRRDTDKLPSITSEALEAHRTAGDPDGPLAAEAGAILDKEPAFDGKGQPTKRDSSYAWLKICLDEAGAVTTIDAFEASTAAAVSIFTEAAKTWTFKPFEVAGTATPVCAMARLSYPPGSASLPETLPMPPSPTRSKAKPIMLGEGSDKLLEASRVSGTRLIYPSDEDKRVMAKRQISRAVGRFRVCMDEQGAVDQVVTMQSTKLADYDQRLIAGMRAWRYKPYKVNDQAVPVCTIVAFAYSQS